MDESLSGVPASGPVADPDAEAIVVRQSRLQRDGLFGGLVAVFLVALVRGYAGAQTVTGRVALAKQVVQVADIGQNDRGLGLGDRRAGRAPLRI